VAPEAGSRRTTLEKPPPQADSMVAIIRKAAAWWKRMVSGYPSQWRSASQATRPLDLVDRPIDQSQFSTRVIVASVVLVITNLLISAFFVWLANKTCDNYQWVSWLITAYFVICIIGAMAILTDPKRYAAAAAADNSENKQPKRVRFTDSS
jgi:hypothetical protein